MIYALVRLVALIDPDSVNVPKAGAGDVQIKTVLQIVFTTIGIIAVLIIAIAGLTYVLSNGDPARIGKAKDAILYAIIGLVVSILSFAIVSFVVGRTF